MEKNDAFLGTEPVGKLLWKLALPTLAAQLINMLYNLVDRVFIGRIPGVGTLALTGVGVCLPLIMIISAFAALVSSGGAPRASIFMGKGDNDFAEKTLGNCFYPADHHLCNPYSGTAPLQPSNAACVWCQRKHH